MSKIGKWSSNAGSNNSTPPDGWPEGQAPSTVNDCAREMMASIRTAFDQLPYYDAGITPSFLSSTTFSLATADTVNFHIGRRVKLFDASTLYGTIDSVSSTFVSVQLDSGALTASLSSVALSVVSKQNSPLPPDTLVRPNAILNGQLDVWQRSATFEPANNAYTGLADGFLWVQNCSCSVRVTKSERSADTSNVPTVAQCGMLLANSLCISVSAVDAALAAGEFAVVEHVIEGYDWRGIAHRPMAMSFWAKTNRTGTYAIAMRNQSATAASVSFVQTFNLSAANTWSKITLSIPEAPTTATWHYNANWGLRVNFVLAAGSNFQGGAGNWTAGSLLTTNAQQNFVASAGNVMRIAGIKLEGGEGATPLEYEPYDQVLSRCQRRYWKGLPALAFNFPAYTASAIMTWPIKFPVTMRTTPGVFSLTAPGISTTNLVSTPTVSAATPEGGRLTATASAANVNTNFSFNLGPDFIEADAEFGLGG